MAKSTSAVDQILARVRKVTQRTGESLRTELQHIRRTKVAMNAKLDEAANRIVETLSRLGISSNGVSVSKPGRQPARQTRKISLRKRIRRTPEQLKKEAGQIVQFVKSAGSDGVTGTDIRKRSPRVGENIKGFVQKYSGRKLKTTGQASSMRYFVD